MITSLVTVGLTEKRRINIEARQNLAIEIALQVQKELDYRRAVIEAFALGLRKPKGTQNRNLFEVVQGFDYRPFTARLTFLGQKRSSENFAEWLAVLESTNDEELFRNSQLAVESQGRIALSPYLDTLKGNLSNLEIASHRLTKNLKKDVNPRWL